MLFGQGHRLRGRGLGALRFSEPSVQPTFEDSCVRQIVRVLAIPCEDVHPKDTLSCSFGVAQDPRELACVTHRSYEHVGNLPKASRFKEAAHARKMLLGSDGVPAKVARKQLRIVSEPEA